MSSTFEYDVFLSYSSKDKKTVHALADRLKKDGLRVWLDAWEVQPGDSIPFKIQQGLEQSRTLLMCMSEAYFGSEWIELEHHTLLFLDPTNTQRRVIPLLIEGCTPADIVAQFEYIDWRRRSDKTYNRLAACLKQDPEKARKGGPKKQSTQMQIALKGHNGSVLSVAVTPNGKFIVSGSSDRTLKVWDLKTGKCLATLEGHKGSVWGVAITPDGKTVVSGSWDGTLKVWDVKTGNCRATLEGHIGSVWSVAIADKIVISGSSDRTLKVWDLDTGNCHATLEGHTDYVLGMAITLDGRKIISCSDDKTLKIWDLETGKCLITLEGHNGSVLSVAVTPNGKIVVSGSEDKTLKVWDLETGSCRATLEGHTGYVRGVVITPDGMTVVSCSEDRTLKVWDLETGSCRATLEGHTSYIRGVAITPDGKTIVSGSWDGTLKVWDLTFTVFHKCEAQPSSHYVNAKVVLVGDSGVGKTGLGWRLAYSEFKEHSSTHGQQFWLLKQLRKQRHDGAQCEAVLWDLAGQKDYRLIHALFLDDVDLALVLFNPMHYNNPLSGVEFWLKQLKVEALPPSGTPTMLIAARIDVGMPRLMREELDDFCKQRGIKAYLPTSAKSGEGIEELIQKMRDIIPWDAKPATITTETFKRIKDFVLDLKENSRRRKMVLTSEELRHRLEKTDRKWKFSDREMMTAVGHLSNHGFVTRLKTSHGELRILLVPELLNNLAASFVVEARRNPRGLGSLEEQRLLLGGYNFPELEKLTNAEKNILLDSTVVLFLEHNICFRETDPLNGRAYLIFPELINLKKPPIRGDIPVEDGIAYTVGGPVENVYASLVVLMGYTDEFTRTNQWRNHARYEVGKGLICGFRLEEERAGELDFVLYFGTNTPAPVRTLFQSLFEIFLARRNLTVLRYEPIVCSKGHILNRAVIREHMSGGFEFAFCSRCGQRITLPKANKPIQLTKQQAEEVEANRQVADQRSCFEQVLFHLKNYITEQKIIVPECFISYAWGDLEQEHWVERNLATDLLKAGITVVLDRWENTRIGSSIPRFVERVRKADRVIVVGTSLYRKKYDNDDPMLSFIVAAEADLIGKRMIGTEVGKKCVLPVLLEGDEESAFPPLLQGRVYADFRSRDAYFETMFELLLSIYQIPPNNPVAIDLRKSLVGKDERHFAGES